MPRVRHRSEAVDVDRGQFVHPSLKDCPLVMALHELSPVGWWAPGRRDGWRLEWFAEVCQGLTSCGRSHPGLRPLANLRFEVSRLLPAVFSEPDVATTPRALEGKLLPHPGHQFRPGDPGGVVRPGLRLSIAAAPRGVTVARMPAGTGVALLADIPDRECRDGFPQPMIRGEHPWLASRQQGHPWPLPPRAVGAKAEVWLDRQRQPPAGLCRCLRGGGTRSARRSRNSYGVSSTTPLAPGRVDLRERPGPTQLAALGLGST